MNSLSVKIGSLTFSDFEEVFIRKSMETLSGIAIFNTANFFQQEQKKLDIHFEYSFDAFINNTSVIKGKVEIIKSKFEESKSSVEIGGRDATSILVDCDWDNSVNEWKKQTILSLVNTICGAFGVSVVIDASASGIVSRVIDSFKINEGEKVYQAIKRLCVENTILPLSYGDGKLTLTRVSTSNYADEQLKAGSYKIIKGSSNQSNIDRFNSYTVKGQSKENDFKDTASYLQVYGKATDSVIKDTKRKSIYLSDTELDFGKAVLQAKNIRNLKAGYSRPYVLTVRDWEQSSKKLWKINYIVTVEVPLLRVKKQLLIYQLDFHFTKAEGFTTDIYLIDKNTYTTNDGQIKSEFDA